MAVDRTERVKPWRALARKHGVTQVKDTASREKVLAMVADLRKLPLRDDRQTCKRMLRSLVKTAQIVIKKKGAASGR